jgi:hypothetical protein
VVLIAGIAATGRAQKPRQDEREIPPTAGVTPIDTPGTARSSVTPLRRSTPLTTRTPRAGAAIVVDANGRPMRTHAPAERSDRRNVATWTAFGVLVIAPGWVTIRMRRHRFDPDSMLEPMDSDLAHASYPYPYTYP